MRTLIRAATIGVLFSACADGPFTPGDDEGWTVATVQGSVVSSYEGNGRFAIEYVDDQGSDAIFELRSLDVMRGGGERLVFQRFGSSLPQPGAYWIGEYDEFFARYELYRNGRWEWYTADFGVIDFWPVSSERMEGEFRFSAALTCVGNGYTMECDQQPAPDAPRILVEGEFAAVRESSWRLE